jgi:8-oxo-dGTP pyrophosphatase MutT (NUDIX family)
MTPEPEELLTIYDASGKETGTKPRGLVHRDGDWHMLVFVLAARLDGHGRKRFLLQLRSGADDPYKGQVDVLAGGHVAANETAPDAALREFLEEVGLRLGHDDLLDLGNHRMENPAGVCRNVIQQFYLCRRPVLLDQPRFDVVGAEVGGYLEVAVDELEALVDGKRQGIEAKARMRADGGMSHETRVTRDHMSAYTPAIADTFRWCLYQVSRYLDTGRIDPRPRA